MEKLIQFANAVGADVKSLKNQDEQTLTIVRNVMAQIELLKMQTRNIPSTEVIDEKITSLKNELFGGDVDAALDTFKELGDKLKALESDESIKGAVLNKFAEISEELTACKTALETDLVEIYELAKA